MSANNQIIVAPWPEDLEKYAVWHDGCVDNPFDFSAKPRAVCDSLEEAMLAANSEIKEYEKAGAYVEYGINFIPRSSVAGYKPMVWDEFPEYRYLGID